MMKYLSVCSGIEAATVAWRPLGWRAAGFSEIEPFPSALLAHHYPDVPNFGDMTNFREWPEEVFAQADMIVGGPPCQAFSVAGKRQGLNDDRGNLTLIYTELIEHADTIRLKHGKPPVIVIYENVPGILSDKTNAFGCLLGALAGEDCELQPSGNRWTNAGVVLGPKRAVAWRVLDAQYFGLAQRRKRVFVVASARKGFCPAQVLFEFDGVRRDIAPSREQGEEAASNVRTGFTPSSFGGYRAGVGTLRANGGDLGGGSETLVTQGFRKLTFESYTQDETASTMMARDYKSYTDLVAFNSRQDLVSRDASGALDTSQPQAQAVCIGGQHPNAAIGVEVASTLTEAMGAGGGHIPIVSGEIAGALDTGVCFTQASADRHAVAVTQVAGTLTTGFGSRGVDLDQIAGGGCAVTQSSVRRLTPVECERLMGFPDGYTAIPWRNKPAEDCPDGHRYKALGNSMAVPCMAWLGQRIQAAL